VSSEGQLSGIRRRWKRLKPFVIIAAALVAVVLAYRMIPYRIRQATLLDSPWNELDFDRDAWINREVYDLGEGTEDTGQMSSLKRGMMLSDLCNNHLRKGMPKAEVRRLLGDPEFKGGEDDIAHSELPANQWTYDLGAWSGFRVDGDFLTIVFDDSDHLDFFTAWQG
jgi:hypothetical protein